MLKDPSPDLRNANRVRNSIDRVEPASALQEDESRRASLKRRQDLFLEGAHRRHLVEAGRVDSLGKEIERCPVGKVEDRISPLRVTVGEIDQGTEIPCFIPG